MPSMPAGGGLRLEAGGRNASDSFGGGSGMPALLLCPASRASAHAGRDTRAPPGPAPPQEFPPTACRAHEHAANRLPGVPQFLLLVYKWEVWLYWCELDLEEMENINSQPRYCRGSDERWGRSTLAAAGLPAASAGACIWGRCVLILTRPKIGLKWCASCGSFALSTISIVLSPADWYLNTFSFVIFLPDVSDNTINQHSPVEMQCNLLMSFHLMNPFPIRILFFPIINNHVSPKRSILRHPALLSVCVNDHRPTFISR